MLDKYTFTEKLSQDQIEDLTDMYAREWWTKSRDFKRVEKMLKSSSLILGICEKDRLIGFARVLTDHIFKAFIFDIIVVEQHRGEGLGDLLLKTILDHKSLCEVSHFELYCKPEMTGFYKKHGFSSENDQIELMRLIR